MSKIDYLQETTQACAGCDALVGEYHRPGCQMERCPYCGGPLCWCLHFGRCDEGSDAPWPPPLDDRIVWTGEWPGEKECRLFGRNESVTSFVSRSRRRLNRLAEATEWDRMNKRFVRTSLTEAFREMAKNGLICHRRVDCDKKQALTDLTKEAVEEVKKGHTVNGYALQTNLGHMRRQAGRDFVLLFGRFDVPEHNGIGLPVIEVGKIIVKCLQNHDVQYKWNGDAERPIRVITASIKTLTPQE